MLVTKSLRKVVGRLRNILGELQEKKEHFRKSIKSRAKVHDLPNERD